MAPILGGHERRTSTAGSKAASPTPSARVLRGLPDGLGILSGSFCPHYDGEPERRPTYTRLVGERRPLPGYAADDNAAFHFHGRELA